MDRMHSKCLVATLQWLNERKVGVQNDLINTDDVDTMKRLQAVIREYNEIIASIEAELEARRKKNG